MAKARVVIADSGSVEVDALRRSFNSLLVVLERVAGEEAAATTTAVQAAAALQAAIRDGIDASAAPHVGTGRMVAGVFPQPLKPNSAGVEVSLDKLVGMDVSSKF
jgi:hypothetical protein